MRKHWSSPEVLTLYIRNSVEQFRTVPFDQSCEAFFLFTVRHAGNRLSGLYLLFGTTLGNHGQLGAYKIAIITTVL